MSEKEKDPFNFKRPEGESYAEVLERAKSFLKQFKPEGTSLIVSHQAFNRTLIGHLAGIEKNKITNTKIPNDVIYLIDSLSRKISHIKGGKTFKGTLKRK